MQCARQWGSRDFRGGKNHDYELHRDNPSDSKLVDPSVKRMKEEMKLPVTKLWADRGMFSAADEALLAAQGIGSDQQKAKRVLQQEGPCPSAVKKCLDGSPPGRNEVSAAHIHPSKDAPHAKNPPSSGN